MPAKSMDIIVTERADRRDRPDLVQAIAPYMAVSWSIGHDIANPLTGIFGLTDELLSGEETLSQVQRESIGQISECADRIYGILQSLAETKSVIVNDDYLRNKVQAIIGKLERLKADD